MKIIYPTDTGIAVLAPTGELALHETARKDVPAGAPFLFVDDEDIPQSREFRAAWEADFSSPDGFGIGQQAWLTEQEAA